MLPVIERSLSRLDRIGRVVREILVKFEGGKVFDSQPRFWRPVLGVDLCLEVSYNSETRYNMTQVDSSSTAVEPPAYTILNQPRQIASLPETYVKSYCLSFFLRQSRGVSPDAVNVCLIGSVDGVTGEPAARQAMMALESSLKELDGRLSKESSDMQEIGFTTSDLIEYHFGAGDVRIDVRHGHKPFTNGMPELILQVGDHSDSVTGSWKEYQWRLQAFTIDALNSMMEEIGEGRLVDLLNALPMSLRDKMIVKGGKQ